MSDASGSIPWIKEQRRSPRRTAETAGTGHQEWLRKLLHMTPGALPFLLASFPHPRPLPMTSLLTVTAITVGLTLLYIALRKRVERPAEHDFYLTTLSYPGTILAMLFLFPHAPELACVVTVILALGDGSAFLAGKWWGERRLPWNGQKTWAGSIAFVAVAGPAASLAYWFEAGAGTAEVALIAGGAAAFLAAIAESLPVRVSDNLRVGVTAAVTVAVCHTLWA